MPLDFPATLMLVPFLLLLSVAIHLQYPLGLELIEHVWVGASGELVATIPEKRTPKQILKSVQFCTDRELQRYYPMGTISAGGPFNLHLRLLTVGRFCNPP
jgi:hypothetical protein